MHCKNNHIATLNGFYKCENLKYIDISGNPVSNINQLIYLRYCPLRTFKIVGCPLEVKLDQV